MKFEEAWEEMINGYIGILEDREYHIEERIDSRYIYPIHIMFTDNQVQVYLSSILLEGDWEIKRALKDE